MTKSSKVPFSVSSAGATTATRYVGGTASGAPSTGTFVAGDFAFAQNGSLWICTVGGTPGTWVNAAAAAGPANMVTTDTTQTISGAKTFTGTVIIGNKALWNGTRTLTTTNTDTVDLGTFASANGAMQLNIMLTVDGVTMNVSKTYELDISGSLMSASTWYKVLPQDSTQNSGATNDFALEVNRNVSAGQYAFRIRQIGTVGGTLYFQAEGWGDNTVTFTPSTAVTAAPPAVSTIWTPTPLYTGPGRVGINNDAPAFELDVTGSVRSTTEIVGPATGNVLKIGDDARLVDINIQHYSGIVSQTDATQGGWSFGNGAGAFRILGNNGGTGTITGALSVTGTTNSVGNLSENGNRVYSLGNKVPVAGLSATGTPDATTFLRGDNTWTVPGGPANMVTTDTTQTISGSKTFTGTATFGLNAIVKEAQAATSGAPLRNSVTLQFAGAYWNGTTSTQSTLTLQALQKSAVFGDTYLAINGGGLYVSSASVATSPTLDVLNGAAGQNIMRLSGTVTPSAFVVSDWGDLDAAGHINATSWVNAAYMQAMATGSSRFVGGSTTGPPTSATVDVGGSFQTGDFVVSRDAVLWVCTAGGNPGTWVSASGGGATKRAFTMTLMGC